MIRPVALLGAVAAAVAAALWLIPASVHIVSWPAAGPVRVALFPSLRSLELIAAVTALVFALLVVSAAKRGAVGTLA